MIDPTTAIRAPGIALFTRPSPRIVARTATDTTSVGTLVLVGIARSVSAKPWIVPPFVSVIASMPPTWPIATWRPTPVRNPTSTLRDRKLAMKPSLRSRAAISRTAHMSAASEASATYSGVCATAPIARSPVARIAAVAESAPTTRWRDDPKIAKTRIGTSSV